MTHLNYIDTSKVTPGLSLEAGSLNSVFTVLKLDSSNLTKRDKILKIMRHKYFYIGIILLVVLDVFVITVELLISLYAAENIIPKDANFYRSELALSIIGLFILFLFVLEILIKIVLIGPRYLIHLWHLIDTLVVFTSFALEIYAIAAKDYSHLSGVDNHSHIVDTASERMIHLKSTGGSGILETGLLPLIIVRMWKLVRVIESVIHSTEMKNEQKVDKLKEDKFRTENKLNHYVREVQKLRSELKFKNLEIKRISGSQNSSVSD
ncbi:hypothetical protein CONCODRAFT_73196 [Conidiobolus coronatus NRRL 28638]|uniref:Voltage-gated hydrogen channel 1 n=1 Tax=Conidiobolus coronatus (strain ATCC 28846 / CBS 209.66 / NRRL 28638) TaxID=796925 RepID=A0A137NWE0_CONC2|nr:hypothetical protein CONCODRAFT_73196 [Conidiobolus coronatus NRRL 28638]|eukprot:KXN67155.1 hypothetical protein CONCODRAFT_73196 [Conidiobolus coronatus NRRL 28638]